MNRMLRDVLVGAGGAVLAVIAMWFLGRGAAIWKHVDTPKPPTVSSMEIKSDSLKSRLDEHDSSIAKALKDITTAVEELKSVRKELENFTVRGTATREVHKKSQGENRIYVNTNSDARRFSIDDQITIFDGRKTISG